MTYSVTNPPVKLVDGLMGGGAAGRGGALWYYASVDDDATVIAANYVTNALDLGMKVGDIVFVVETDNSYKLAVVSVTAVAAAGSTMAFGVVS
jgi:hypothetical protein